MIRALHTIWYWIKWFFSDDESDLTEEEKDQRWRDRQW